MVIEPLRETCLNMLAALCCCCCCRCVLCRLGSLGANLCFAVSSLSRPTGGVVGNGEKKRIRTNPYICGRWELISIADSRTEQSHGLLLLIEARTRRPWLRAAAAVATRACFPAVCSPASAAAVRSLSHITARGKMKWQKLRWVFPSIGTYSPARS